MSTLAGTGSFKLFEVFMSKVFDLIRFGDKSQFYGVGIVFDRAFPDSAEYMGIIIRKLK